MKQVGKLNPFGRFCCTIGNLPTSYMESLTYEQQLLWFCKFLDTEVIPAVNANAEAIIELQNYLKNLDLQDYVDNKLDEMAESGQLTDIIAQYLQLAGLLCFNTKADLKAAQNLVDGSFAKTFGTSTYNDGYGYFYKIRTLINTDVIDDDNLLALTDYPTLVAEKIPDATINLILNSITTINNSLSLLTNKKVIFIGDSYAEGYTPDGNVTSWVNIVINNLNLSNSIVKYLGGTGFVNEVDNKNFNSLLNEVQNDNTVTDIIVCGGYNDKNSIGQIGSKISEFKNTAATKFPNAKIHIGAIGCTTNNNETYNIALMVAEYRRACIENGLHFLDGCQYVLHDYALSFSSDGIHPNQYGQNYLGYNIAHAFINGSSQIYLPYTNIVAGTLGSDVTSQALSASLGHTLCNNIVNISLQHGEYDINVNNLHYTSRDGLEFKVFDIDYSQRCYVIGNIYNYCVGNIDIIVRTSDNNYYKLPAQVIIRNGSVYLRICGSINDQHNNYLDFYIAAIQLLTGFNTSIDTLMS